MNVVDTLRRHAEARPEHPALCVDRGGSSETIGYAALLERVDARAAALRDEGLSRGERCGLVARPGPAFIETALAILEAGGCLVPVPDDAGDEARTRFATQAKLHAWCRESEAFRLERLPEVESSSSAVEPGSSEAEPSIDEAAFRALDPAYLRFTSGTTSTRKGVILSHARILERLDAANAGLEIGPQDRVLWLLPMAHHFVVSILLYLRSGATVLLPQSALAKPVLAFAGRERATVSYASPYHYHLLSKDASDARLPLRLAVSTAEGLRAEVAERFQARFGFPLSQALGIIEVGLPVLNRDEAATKPTALGKPLPAYDVWLRDDEGKRIQAPGAPDRTGEVCIRGPGLFDAYLDPWTPSASLLGEDGFRTGDQGWFDADGTLHLAGRRHNRINMAGMKFFSEEVESVLLAHPAVQECRVFARTHPQLGEIPVAEIVADPAGDAPDRADLTRHCRRSLPSYKVPREFRVVDALARTATGKLQR
ncbi:MAG: class I adenylate-forming enzyme family protein [Myxococcota bacterium]